MNPYGAPEITVLELKQRLDAGEQPLLLDVREQNEWDYVRLESATLVPLSLLARQGPSALPAELSQDSEAVVYCHHGVRSAQVVAWLASQGYRRAVSLEGGIDAWTSQVDPTLPRY